MKPHGSSYATSMPYNSNFLNNFNFSSQQHSNLTISFVSLISHDIRIKKVSRCPSSQSCIIPSIFIFSRAIWLRHRFLIEKGSLYRHVKTIFLSTKKRTWRSVTIAANSSRLKSIGTSFWSLSRTIPPREVYYSPCSRLTRGCARSVRRACAWAKRTCFAMITFAESRDKRVKNNKKRNSKPDR